MAKLRIDAQFQQLWGELMPKAHEHDTEVKRPFVVMNMHDEVVYEVPSAQAEQAQVQFASSRSRISHTY